MKTFKDLQFKPLSIYDGLQATINFDNHYGVSVVEFYEYYGVNSNLWELKILHKDTHAYNTGMPDGVIGGLTEQDVTYIMKKVQAFSNNSNSKSWRFCPNCGTEWTEDCDQFGCWDCGYYSNEQRNEILKENKED